MRTTVLPLLFLALLAAGDKPAPKVPVSKETTYITEPLDKDGYPDYPTAVNDLLGKGITPDKNANVLLWKALGPTPEGNRMPAEFFKRLGIDEPTEKGDYFVSMRDYFKDRVNLENTEFGEFCNQQSEVAERPWAEKSFPLVAAWLKSVEKPLAVVVEATKRTDYYNPLISPKTDKGEPGLIMAMQLQGARKCRELAVALIARAMLRIEEKKFEDAWQDLLACHRLGRLLSRGGTIVETLIGHSLNQLASDRELIYLERAELTAEQIRDRLKDLQTLPPLAPVAKKVELAERMMFLDAAQSIRRGMLRAFKDGRPGNVGDTEFEKLLIDWDVTLRNSNRCYDRLVAALREKDRTAREKEFDKIAAEENVLQKEIRTQGERTYLMKGKDDPKLAGKLMGDVLVCLLFPATRKLEQRYETSLQVEVNLQLAFALAAYRRDTGKYPAKLDDLTPKYVATVPDDIFSGRPLRYRLTEKGCLLYSVGVDGKDENGHQFDDDPRGDDIRIRLPLGERK